MRASARTRALTREASEGSRLRRVIVDAHNDLLLELVLSREQGKFGDLVLRTADERLFDRYWLPRLEAGGVGIQVCPLYAAEKKYAHPRERVLALIVARTP